MKILAKPYCLKYNPYTRLYYNSLESKYRDIEVIPYSFINLFRKVDIFHIHWPESILNNKKNIKKILKLIKFFMVLFFLKLRGVKVVWTVHNFRPHLRFTPYKIEEIFYKKWIYFVDALIFLSNASKSDFELLYPNVSIHSTVIPHGHYFDYLKKIKPTNYLKEEYDIKENEFVIGHYGLIKPYKNITLLIKEFSKIKESNIRLIIAGKISKNDNGLRADIIECAKLDERVTLHLKFLQDSELIEFHNLTDLCIYPYSDILNSGSIINSLSLGCPVVAPENNYFLELQENLKEKKLFLYKNQFSEKFIVSLLNNIDVCRVLNPKENLSNYEWDISSRLSVDLFKKLLYK